MEQIPNILIDNQEADKVVDWRKEDIDDAEDNDEELDQTPEDVIEGLGFDPKEFSEE